ncbi:MAG: exonuclease domain-containing protein [Planctomycetota bacterium]
MKIAVIDVETTGLRPTRHDRVIEIGVVVITTDGEIVREYETLINPKRDLGPTEVHGITGDLISQAPTWRDAAGGLLTAVNDAEVIAGHNVWFDGRFLSHEFAEIRRPLQIDRTLCTCRLAGGGTLGRCCEEYGLEEPQHAHTAIDDARATAHLLLALIHENPDAVEKVCLQAPIQWPNPDGLGSRTLTRKASTAALRQQPGLIQRLARSVSRNNALNYKKTSEQDYVGLLCSVLEDGRLDQLEEQHLADLASAHGLGLETLECLHLEYLQNCIEEATADGVVTAAEQRDLDRLARLLGIPDKELDSAIQMSLNAPASNREIPSVPCDLEGQTVCFTGALQHRVNGQVIKRSLAETIATEYGLIPQKGVTKELDILVVADPDSASAKAKKARDYGTRVIYEPDFWRLLGVNTS